jgi:spore germination protein Q
MPMQQALQQPFANQPMPMQQPMSMQQPIATQQAATMPPSVASGNVITPSGTVLTGLPQEQSFIENILRLNLGKVGTFYMTYENNSEWNAKIFRGKIEAAGRDHLIISDPRTGQRIMLLMVNFDYATFDEPLNYEYPFRQPESSEEQ